MCIVTDSGGSLFTNTWLADIHQPHDDDDDDDGDDDDDQDDDNGGVMMMIMFMEMMVVYRYLVGRNTPIPPGLNLPTVSIIQPAHEALRYYYYCYDLKETRLSILLLLSGHLFLLNG